MVEGNQRYTSPSDTTRRGRATMRIPEPNSESTPKYRSEGVRIGDVGILKAGGSSDSVFSTCRPSNDRMNRFNYGVPADVEQLEWDDKRRSTDNAFRLGEPISIRDAKNQALGVQGTVSALGIPLNGVNSVDCQNLAVLHKYAERHAVSWRKFMKETLGMEADSENGTIYLATRYDKPNRWEKFFTKERMSEMIVNTGGLAGDDGRLHLLTDEDDEMPSEEDLRRLDDLFRVRGKDGYASLGRAITVDSDSFQQSESKKIANRNSRGVFASPCDRQSHPSHNFFTAMDGHHPTSSERPRPTAVRSGISFQCERNTTQGYPVTTVRRDDRGWICLPPFEGCTSETAQKFADLVQGEIQTIAAADAEYRKKCTKYLKDLFKTHRVLPASLFVNDVVRPRDKLQPVGGGGFSDIYTGLHGDKTVCLKVLRVYLENDTNTRKRTIDTLYEEAILWTQLKHPNVLRFLGANKELFSDYQFCMVSPWMVNGSVLQFLKKNPNHDKLTMIREIASGVAYLHSRGVVHGDIKPVNILVDEDGRCRLSDFGLAAIVSETSYLNTTMNDGQKGTIRYMAPETILSTISSDEDSSKANKFAADVYAYASTIYEIITGKPPYSKLPDGVVIVHIMNQLSQPGKRPTEVGIWCPDNVWMLIEKCWHRQPLLRPKASEVQAFLDRIEELRFLDQSWDQIQFDSVWRESSKDFMESKGIRI